MTRVYLTGASGFVGTSLLSRLCDDMFSCTVVVRGFLHAVPSGVRVETIASLKGDADLQAGLIGQDVVIHCAGRAHVMHETAADPLADFRAVNLHGTLNLARQAAAAGIKRFIFLSSIKVNGEETLPGKPFTADDVAAPVDPYGISKMEAEQGLRSLAAETGMEVVIIRPVLVYGPGVKANFRSMMSWLSKGVPLPLGAISNKRSLVALENLVDLIVTCVHHPAAANQTFLVSDGEDISTSEMLIRMGQALNKPARLLPLPEWALQSVATLLGKRAVAQRLCGSLQVDISKTRSLLDWAPPVSLDQALAITAKHYLDTLKK